MSTSTSTPATEIFGVLSNQRRQYVLRILDGRQAPIDLGELTTEVAALENGVSPEAVSGDQRNRTYSALLQNHLPRMDDTGTVNFDAERNLVRPTDRTHQLTVYLEVVPGNELAWRDYYLLIGLLGCSLALAVWTGIYPWGALPASAWFAAYAGLVTVSALVHRVHDGTIRLVAGERPLGSLLRWP